MSTELSSSDNWQEAYEAYKESGGRYLQIRVKRAVDLTLSALACIGLSPFLLLIGLAVKATSPGPVMFRQNRLGQLGKNFRIYKFRTMVDGAVHIGAGLATYREDPRVTKIGKFLREYHLDELPQIFNVLQGDMSLVGPRPVLPSALETYSDWEKRRLLVPPGITGWQQVRGGALNDVDERIRLDVWYVDHWTWRLDLLIMLQTVRVVLTREGVYGADGWQRGRVVEGKDGL